MPDRAAPIRRSAINSAAPLRNPGRRTYRAKPPKNGPDPEWPAAKAVALNRDSYRCRKCGAPTRIVHHRRLKGSGGSTHPDRHRPDRLVSLCLVCHDWVHGDNNRKAAEALGLIVPRTLDTREVPVHTLEGRFIFTERGTVMAA